MSSRFWDKTAPKYALSPIKDMESYRTTMERTKAHLDQGDEVLEVGCGTGSTALLLAPNVKSLTASDFSDGMIKIATDKLTAPEAPGNVTFRQAVIGDHVAAGERYDAVLAFNFLHLVDDVPGAIEQIRTLLKPGGLFISKSVCLGSKAWLFKPLIGALQLIGKAPHVSLLTIEQLDGHIRDAGFQILDEGCFPASPPSRFVVAKRLDT